MTIFPPPPRSIMCRATARVQRNVPRTFTRCTSSNASSVSSTSGTRSGPGRDPALFTRMSIRPKRSSVSRTIRSTDAPSDTSPTSASELLPVSAISAATDSSPCQPPALP